MHPPVGRTDGGFNTFLSAAKPRNWLGLGCRENEVRFDKARDAIEDVQDGQGERYIMGEAILRAVRRNRPCCGLEIDLGPAHFCDLPTALPSHQEDPVEIAERIPLSDRHIEQTGNPGVAQDTITRVRLGRAL